MTIRKYNDKKYNYKDDKNLTMPIKKHIKNLILDTNLNV